MPQLGTNERAHPRQFQRDADGYLPIEGYGAIGNGRTVALVGFDGSIDWCPFSRFDRPTTFARLLDARKGGHWQIVPEQPWSARRHYLGDTPILVTEFTTASGVVELIDLMPSIAFGADLGISNALWDGMLLRFVRGVRGRVRLRHELAPAFNYARDATRVEVIPGRGALLYSDNGALRFVCQLPMTASDQQLYGTFEVKAGDVHYAAATYHWPGATLWTDLPPETAQQLLEREIEGWKRWISRCTYTGPYAEHVRRGALTLKLLDYQPTGAMAAAATTSLPERIGGVRNWDYRYAWIRDTAYAIHAMHSLGYRDEAEGFLQWVIDASRDEASALCIMYQVDGGRDMAEVELPHLEGYKQSRPVRIGNAAADQRQLDRFGEVVDAAYVHRQFGGAVNDILWSYLCEVVDEVLLHWREPDAGIWEVRSVPRRMTYSNVMCWVALDRAIKLAELDERPAPLEHWRAARDAMCDDVLTLGVAPEGYFSQGFGDSVLDAAALSFPLRGFIDVDDPRMVATIHAIASNLTQDGLVARYHVHDDIVNVDGLPGDEGRFVLTSCWLIECLTGLGEIDKATALLEQLLERANDLGLYAEEIDPTTGAFLGNFPQAFSHLGIINAIFNLARVRGEVGGEPQDALKTTGSVARGPENRRLAGRPDG